MMTNRKCHDILSLSSGRVVGDTSYQRDFNSLNIPSFYPEKCSAFEKLTSLVAQMVMNLPAV